jgi:hypothetical protein
VVARLVDQYDADPDDFKQLMELLQQVGATTVGATCPAAALRPPRPARSRWW